ncbi:hypothetical protein MLD38_022321 [Melastoma candidum]|uniref:Uncharacterized protein n=1 Tax=Melastoma candidum TaxID=119954 RepID=A0ACB9QS07_9MYRT|nr:hypothetical protein MLD38_022321 [Melastoma candidum]
MSSSSSLASPQPPTSAGARRRADSHRQKSLWNPRIPCDPFEGIGSPVGRAAWGLVIEVGRRRRRGGTEDEILCGAAEEEAKGGNLSVNLGETRIPI